MTTLELVKAVYVNRVAIGAAAGSVVAGVGLVCTGLAHWPGMPAKWAERFARFAGYTSQKFSVNLRPKESTPANPIAPEGDK